MRHIATMMIFGALASAPAVADSLPGDPEAGLEFARGHCAHCHYVERGWGGVSPYNAPGFEDIAAQPKYTALSLRVFLRTPHVGLEMPDFILTEQQTDDVISYILSLRKAE